MAGSYEDYKTYLGDLYKDVLKKTQTINYTPRSDGQLKAMIQGYLRPGLDKNIAAREQQGRMNNSAVDADAAARGMGGSTWLTDMKNRQNNAVSSDISGLRSDYTTNLFNSLMSKISEQDANMMQVQQFNANAKNKALDRAFAAANANINSWARSSGGGGGVQPPPDVTDPAFGNTPVANPSLKTPTQMNREDARLYKQTKTTTPINSLLKQKKNVGTVSNTGYTY